MLLLAACGGFDVISDKLFDACYILVCHSSVTRLIFNIFRQNGKSNNILYVFAEGNPGRGENGHGVYWKRGKALASF